MQIEYFKSHVMRVSTQFEQVQIQETGENLHPNQNRVQVLNSFWRKIFF